MSRRLDSQESRRNRSPGQRAYDSALRLARSQYPKWPRVLSLLRESISLGNVDAAYALATWYLHGKEDVVKQSYREAVKLLRFAAETGHAQALYDLAVCYHFGEGVKQNERMAFGLYLASALRGDVDAIVEVSRCYRYGYGVDRNPSVAKIIWARAIEMGADPNA